MKLLVILHGMHTADYKKTDTIGLRVINDYDLNTMKA